MSDDARDPRERFEDRVDEYALYRPGYPGALIDHLLLDLRVGRGATVADVGAGTGILSDMLIERGLAVTAVEPNAAMRRELERRLGDRDRLRVVDGSAERTGLDDGSVALVTAAQAFHWFDPVRAGREFRRILRPGGMVALLWNRRRSAPEPFLRDYEALLAEFGTDYERVDHTRAVGTTELAAFFGHAGYHERRMPNAQELDRRGLRGRLLSSSYLPGPGSPGAETMLAAAAALFERHQRDGRVRLDYDTEVFWGVPGSTTALGASW